MQQTRRRKTSLCMRRCTERSGTLGGTIAASPLHSAFLRARASASWSAAKDFRGEVRAAGSTSTDGPIIRSMVTPRFLRRVSTPYFGAVISPVFILWRRGRPHPAAVFFFGYSATGAGASGAGCQLPGSNRDRRTIDPAIGSPRLSFPRARETQSSAPPRR